MIKIESYLGKNVKIKIHTETGKDTYEGILRRTGDDTSKNDPNLYLKRNYYFTTKYDNTNSINSCLFRASHVKSVSEIKEIL